MTDPREEKTHRKRGARQEEEKERSKKRPTKRNQKGMRMTRNEKELRKPKRYLPRPRGRTPSRREPEI